MSISRIVTFCLICLLAPIIVSSANASVILNTLQGYSNDHGWSGGLDGLFSGSGGNTEQIAFETSGRIQWQGEKHRYRMQISGGYQENNGVESARSVVAHARYNRFFDGPWSIVSFGQIQHNPFQRLSSRWLVGLGPRYDFAHSKNGVVTLGATPMLEIERLEDLDGHLTRGRLSTFLHLAYRLSSNTKLDAVAFWQPLFDDFSNSRAVGNITLTVDISGEVDLKIGAAVQDNTRAPKGVKRTDWSTFTGLGVSF